MAAVGDESQRSCSSELPGPGVTPLDEKEGKGLRPWRGCLKLSLVL